MGNNRKNTGFISETLFFIMLIHFQGVSASCRNVDSLGKFIIQPNMGYVSKEGGNITLTCSASLSTHREISLEWTVVPDIYTKQVTVSRVLLHVNSTINIYRIGRMHQKFTCIIYTNNGTQKLCQKSRTAKTNIVYFPRKDEVSCGPQKFHNPFIEGDMVDIYCSAPRSRPSVDLIWLTGDSNLNENVGSSSLTDGLRRVLTTRIRITRRFHFISLKCKITSQRYFPGQKRECKIGMVTVNHKPKVNLSLLALNVYNDDFHLHFQCTAIAYPDGMIFSWNFSPRNHLRACESSKNIANISLPLARSTAEESIVTITCHASNNIGTSSDYFEIRLIKNNSVTLCSESIVNFGGNTLNFSFPLVRYYVSALEVLWFSDGIQFEIINSDPLKSTPSLITPHSEMSDIKSVTLQKCYSSNKVGSRITLTCGCFNEPNDALFHTSDQRDNERKPLTELKGTPNTVHVSLNYEAYSEKMTFNTFTTKDTISAADEYFSTSHKFIPSIKGEHGNYSRVNYLNERKEPQEHRPNQGASNSNIWRNVSFACLTAIFTASVCGVVAIAVKRHIKKRRQKVNTGSSNVHSDNMVAPFQAPIYEVPKELKMKFELQHGSVVFDNTSVSSQDESINSSSDSSQYQSDSFSSISGN